jgi:hypothetical protein
LYKAEDTIAIEESFKDRKVGRDFWIQTASETIGERNVDLTIRTTVHENQRAYGGAAGTDAA